MSATPITLVDYGLTLHTPRGIVKLLDNPVVHK